MCEFTVCVLMCFYQIARIENPQLYERYAVMREQMTVNNGPSVENERLLWHGTSPDTVKIICQRGFNRSYCGKNGMLFVIISAIKNVKFQFRWRRSCPS